MSEAQRERQPLRAEQIDETPVYPIIHMIRSDIAHFIDTALSYEALSAPDLTYTLVQPLYVKYSAIQRAGNMSVVFCLLLNRVHFRRDQNLTTSPVSRSRAALCEILATRLLTDYGNSLLDLTLALTTSWLVYSGADPGVIAQAREDRDDLEDRVGNAMEMAILGQAKRFIKSNACQRVINSIWTGKCVYQASSNHAILSDTYKRLPIHFYDPHKAPLLDHYRLKVPAIRSVLEYINFLILFVLFVIAIETNEQDKLNISELIFIVYAFGFTLEKVAAMQEHGIKVFFKGTWNGFDLAFVTTFLAYAFLRIYGVYYDHPSARRMGMDFLAIIACLMFPRLAFVTLRNNLMVLSLRAMMLQFLFLMMIAAFCFGGFLYALWTLSRNGAQYSVGTIAWWMLDLWFGLDASGFDRASTFHPIFGPILMVTYACLSNTLLLTVLVSILSNTFSNLSEDAAAEAMFRRAVSTIEGVKADSLFSYQPPINLAAVMIMFPAGYLLTPRWFHKVNVFFIRLTNFPILLCIAWYERQAKRSGATGFYDTISSAKEKFMDTLPRNFFRLSLFEGLAGAGGDIDAIFEIEDEINGTAVDMAELGMDDPPVDHFHRGLSSRHSSASHTPKPSRALSPQRPEQNRPSSPSNNGHNSGNGNGNGNNNNGFGPRRRLTSTVNRMGDGPPAFTSPLAQLYQPLMMEEEISETSSVNQSGNGQRNLGIGGPLGVSYGPTSRRRLSSVAGPRPGVAAFGPSSASYKDSLLSQGNLRKFPSGSHSASERENSMAVSPEQEDELPKRSSSAMDETSHDSGVELAKRLRKIEESQKRIEQLLMQVAAR